jgi:hypothetical protein
VRNVRESDQAHGSTRRGPSPAQENPMSRPVLIAIIIVLLGAVGLFAYQAYERDQNTLDISIGEKGIKVD